MTRLLALLAAIALLGLAIALAACGDDGESGDAESGDAQEVEDVVVRSVTAEDPSASCEDSLSPALIRTIYGDVETCHKLSISNNRADDGTVTDVQVDGDTATATVELVGGPTPGVRGGMELVREAGEWRISELGVDFLRGLADKNVAASESNDLDDPEVRSCLRQALDDLPDEEFRAFAYAGIGGKPEGPHKLGELLHGCTS